jgi:mitochondrial fission protein ELM1
VTGPAEPQPVVPQATPVSPTGLDTARHPVIWAISAWRAGDQAQLLALAAALKEAHGWVVDFKPVCDRRQDPASFGYTAPWPDAVMGIGRGGTRMAMWLKQASGGQSKFVQLGRSEGPMADCDLIITTAQYGFPDNPNLIRLTLPLTQQARPDDPAIAAWAGLADRPRPLIGALVGGPSDPLQFGVAEGQRLVADLATIARETKGSLLIATGRRTPPEVIAQLQKLVAAAPDQHKLIVFPPAGFARPEDNPYRAILAIADRFTVTADSVSMLADACATGKPVTLFDLPAMPEERSFLQYWRRRRRRRFALGLGRDPIDCLYDAGIRRGWIRPGRDVPTLLAWLKRTGGVSGDPQAAPGMAARLRAEREVVLTRLYRLLAS